MKIITYLLIIISTTVSAQVTFKGVAFGKDEKIVYEELHELTLKDDKVVSSITKYMMPINSSEPTAILSTDLTPNSFLPHYEFVDKRFNEAEGIFYQSNDPYIFFKDKKTRLTKNKDEIVPYIGGQGFHYFVQAQLDQIIEKKTLNAMFVVPKRQDIYSFRIKLKEIKDNKVSMIFEPQSWLIRVFAPKMEVDYDLLSKRLIQYRGPSNILTDKGEIQDVVINYYY